MNDPFYRQDIFFFVTTIAVIVIGLLVAILMVYLIKVFKDIKYITTRARQETDLIAKDIEHLREDIKEKGFRWSFLGKFFSRLYSKRK